MNSWENLCQYPIECRLSSSWAVARNATCPMIGQSREHVG
jgi:hypothetical protein